MCPFPSENDRQGRRGPRLRGCVHGADGCRDGGLYAVCGSAFRPGVRRRPWTIAKPLLLFIASATGRGDDTQRRRLDCAKVQPYVKKITGIDTMILGVVIWSCTGRVCRRRRKICDRDAVAVFCRGDRRLVRIQLRFATRTEERRLPRPQSTRNIGAALAPLFAIPDVDQRAIVMVALGVPMQTIFSLLAASWFSRRATNYEALSVRRAGAG